MDYGQNEVFGREIASDTETDGYRRAVEKERSPGRDRAYTYL